MAEHYPALWRLTGRPGATLWAQRAKPAGDFDEDEHRSFDPTRHIGSDTWGVFGSDRRYLGTVVMPERFDPLTPTDRGFWGIWHDELDVQHVAFARVSNEGAGQ